MHPPLSRKRGLVDAVRNVPAPPAQLLLAHREGVRTGDVSGATVEGTVWLDHLHGADA
jgi:hypothetical protein